MRLQAFQGLDTDDESLVATKRREPYKFFVYSEIDSLEYAARRYRFGLGLNHEICNRALRHFRSLSGLVEALDAVVPNHLE